jgi:hypothetical protein
VPLPAKPLTGRGRTSPRHKDGHKRGDGENWGSANCQCGHAARFGFQAEQCDRHAPAVGDGRTTTAIPAGDHGHPQGEGSPV